MTTTRSTQAAEAGFSYLSHRQILVVLGGLMAGMFLAALDQSILGTALPAITSDLGGLERMSWVVTAYLLTSTASTPLWGKISDLNGRRPIFQLAIVIFVLGSVLSGLAQNIEQLIGFRAVQGLGAGGLFALALATIGDVIPPRERGRYQGYFGAVFGTSSVLGPVLGGWLTDGPGWRWVFWINVPIGLGALLVTSLALKLPHTRREHTIDYLGAALVVASVTSLLLYTAWAGPEAGWTSLFALGLLAAGAVLAVLFVLVELRAVEPIIPMELFRDRIVSLSLVFVFIIGLAMFGALVFMPLYLQIVAGMSPTRSGLAMLPMVAGLFATSISAGQVMTRTGRYKMFPIVGAAVVLVGLLLLSDLGVDTPYWRAGLAMFVLGAGLGCTMQILVTAVQNAVQRRHMGSATSSVTFFRSMGGAFGTALFGAILSSRLGGYLAERLPAGTGGNLPEVDTSDITAIQALPPALQDQVVESFALSLQDTFVTALPFVAVALVIAFFIPEKALTARESSAPEAVEAATP